MQEPDEIYSPHSSSIFECAGAQGLSDDGTYCEQTYQQNFEKDFDFKHLN